jgi:N-methylhydantoinase A
MTSVWHVGVDIGGTFTDVVAVEVESGEVRQLKVASSRDQPARAVLAGVRALEEEAAVDPGQIRLLLHGTTLATNAIIERRLARTALVTTAGFRDVLEIGRHWREELYDPFISPAPPLVTRDLRFEVEERIDAGGGTVTALDRDANRELVETLREQGVEAVAVVFLHSFRNPAHEAEMAELLRSADGWAVCPSSELLREVKEFERTSTTVLNAALMPLVDAYLDELEQGLAAVAPSISLFVTQSNGGALTPRSARARPVSLALSGPVGGVVACTELSRTLGRPSLVGLDMGGTSADVSVITEGEPRYTTELAVGELPVRLPSIQVHSIGAGGGSIASVDTGGALHVGPESAGSSPGPACYGFGGERPTVTDCQLVLGRLAEEFPLAGRLKLDLERARRAVEEHIAAPLSMPVEEAAAGVIEVANAAMERAIRVALRDRGDDPREFALVAFGGAGPLHGAELARRLGIETVLVPPRPGTLSARGFLSADVRLDFSSTDIRHSDEPGLDGILAGAYAELERQARAEIERDSRLAGATLEFDRSCDVRYLGQAYEVSVPVPNGELTAEAVDELVTRFHELHERAYAFSSPDERCELVTVRVSASVNLDKPPSARSAPEGSPADGATRAIHVPGEGTCLVPVHSRDELGVGARIQGPAVVHQADCTTYLPPFAAATVDDYGNLCIEIEGSDW